MAASIGFPWVVGTVESIGERSAIVLDQYQRRINVRTDIRRGPKPQVGEKWIVDRALGAWTFQAVVRSFPPTVIGDVQDGSTLRSLIDALVIGGANIEDGTETGDVPVVSGTNYSNPALRSLLDALAAMGLILDTTTDSGVFPHSH